MTHIRTLLAAALATLAFAAHAAVDVNKASQAELESVKGIGPALSAKILEARKAGEFKSWTDLVDRVVGIGTGNAGRLSQAGLTVRGSAYPGSPAAAPAKTAAAPTASATAPAKPAAAAAPAGKPRT